MNLEGVALASNITMLANFLLTALYICLDRTIVGAWTKPTADSYSFEGLRQYFVLGIPAAAMLCLEWWTFDIQILLAAYISTNAIDASVIIATLLQTFDFFTSGL